MKAIIRGISIQRYTRFLEINLRKFFSSNAPKLKNFINGEFIESKANNHYEIHNPATNELLSFVPETPKEEFYEAVSFAKNTFTSWKNIPVITRQRYMFDYLRLLKENQVFSH